MTETPNPAQTAQPAIDQLLIKFTKGDPGLFEHIAQDIDFRIDHFRDEIDLSWQSATSLEELAAVIERLGKEIFPKGTQALGIDTQSLGNGWSMTCFNQKFFYGVRQQDVTSLTYIMSHETDGKVDFFRETVTNIVNA